MHHKHTKKNRKKENLLHTKNMAAYCCHPSYLENEAEIQAQSGLPSVRPVSKKTTMNPSPPIT